MKLPPSLATNRVYTTPLGTQLCGDSRELLRQLEPNSVDLVVTSPPFALLRKKAYGNEEQEHYVEWLAKFGVEAKRVLKDTGSLVIDLGGAYQRGAPVRSLYPFEVLITFVKDLDFRLAEDFYWHNPAKLPSPAEWVTKRKIRVKDSVNTVWWLSKTEVPKADVKNVLAPYSDRMKKLLEDPGKFYKPGERPSGHDISEGFGKDRGGAIPSNLLVYPNTSSSGHYQRTCKALDRPRHPARFPEHLPNFFIRFLTEPGDVVLDIFSGSNTTGLAAERLGRRWLGMELSRDYAALSSVRFMDGWDLDHIRDQVERMEAGECVELAEPSLEAPLKGLEA